MAERDEEQAGLCDICHRRPAALRVTVSENGRARGAEGGESPGARGGRH